MEQGIKEPSLEDLELVSIDRGGPDECQVWQIKGSYKFHHPHEPAVQFSNGNWAWHWMNQPHRLDGPARWRDGRYEYHIHGERLSREEWERDPRRLEWLRVNKLRGI